jgi:hypothetical protein
MLVTEALVKVKTNVKAGTLGPKGRNVILDP